MSVTSRCHSAALGPSTDFEAALHRLRTGDDPAALHEFYVETATPLEHREWVRGYFGTLRSKNTGRPKARRNPDGTTPAQAAAAKGYATFHDKLASGVNAVIADANAVSGNPLFAKVAKERRELIYRNGVTEINNVTRAKGTYVKNAAALFLGF